MPDLAVPFDEYTFSSSIQPVDATKLDRLKRQVEADPVLSPWIRFDEQHAIGIVDEGRFESRFSPLLDLTGNAATTASRPVAATSETGVSTLAPDHAPGRAPLGWRARVLAFDRTAVLVSSAAMFASIENASLLVSLDRMTRTLHSLNFFASDTPGLLFLPVHERLLKSVRYDHGKHFAAVLVSLGLNPARVVIEIPGAAAVHKTFLAYLVDSYRSHGFKVAANLSTAASILSLLPSSTPDFIIADVERTIRDSLVRALVTYAERIGTALIFDGIEDAQMLALIQQHGVRYAAAPQPQRGAS